MKKTTLLTFTILITIALSACAGPLADKNIAGDKGASEQEEEIMEEKKMEEGQAPFAKRFLEEPGHTDLAAEYKYAVLKTSLGDIKLEFFADKSPITVNNFLNLAESGFYDGVTFHRVIKDFMIQGGDPNSKDDDRSNDGQGGPGYNFADEINNIPLVKGNLAMANAGPNTNGSQFFIITALATPWLDGKHTNFGKVVEGIDVVSKIEAVEADRLDNPIERVVIKSIQLIKN